MLIGNENICPLCFEKMSDNQTECYRCDGVSNLKRYPTSLEEGTILNGKYMIGKVIGRGGFGITYLALDLALRVKVAIKEFFPNTLAHRDTGSTHISLYEDDRGEDFLNGTKSFTNEARIISGLSHNQNVVKVYDLFYENNTAYYVMEYLEGVNMKAYIKNLGRKLTEDETFRIMNDIFPAVTAVHSLSMLHRDISPDNIFICNDGRTKLIDFGASRQYLSEESRSLTVVLKHGFAPFEQYKTHGNQGPWTDVYSLGATIYYALTGKVLLDAPSRTDNPYIEMTGIRPELANILLRMLSVDIENRYKSVEDVTIDLMRINAGTGTYIPPVGETEKAEKNQETIVKSKKEPEKIKNNQKQNVSDNNTNAVNNSKPAQERKFKPGRTVLLLLIILISFGTLKNYIDKHGLPANDTFANVNVSENTTENSVDTSVNINVSTSDVLISVQTDEGWSVINAEGEKVFDLDTDVTDMTGFVNGVAAAKKSGKWGIIDTEGKYLYDCIFDYAPYLSTQNKIAAVSKDGKYALMNSKWELVTDFIYDSIDFKDAIIVSKNKRYGLINSEGETVIPVEYSSIICNGKTVQVITDDYGSFSYTFSDTENMYTCKEEYPEPLFLMEKGSLYGFCNAEGETVITPKWPYARTFSDGYAVVSTGVNGYNYIDMQGKKVFSEDFDYACGFACGVASVKKDNKWGYISPDGTVAIDYMDCNMSFDFNPEGFARILGENGKYGAIDINGNTIAEPVYGWVNSLYNGLYVIESDNKCGVVDSSGKKLLEMNFSSIYSSPVSDNLIKANIGATTEYYAYSDGELHLISNDFVHDYKNGYFIAEKNNKCGLVDEKGNIAVDFKYDYLCFTDSTDVLIADYSEKWGCINYRDEILINFSYKDMA